MFMMVSFLFISLMMYGKEQQPFLLITGRIVDAKGTTSCQGNYSCTYVPSKEHRMELLPIMIGLLYNSGYASRRTIQN